MPRTLYLADTSAFSRLSKPIVASAAAPLIAEGRIAVCAPVMFELGFSAQGPADHQELMEVLTAFPHTPTTDADHRRAIEVQGILAQSGQHRSLSLVDALIAAIAEARQLTVLHYDADFERVAAITGQPHKWIVERGTAD